MIIYMSYLLTGSLLSSRIALSLLCLLHAEYYSFPASHAEDASDELCYFRAFVVGGYRVHDDAWVDIGVHDADGRYVLERTFADGVDIRDGVQEDSQVGGDTVVFDGVCTEHLKLVRQRPWEPLLPDVEALLAKAFCGLAHGRTQVWPRAHENDGPVLGGDRAHDLRCPPEEREGRVEVDDGDARAHTVGIRSEVGVHERFCMAEVGTRGEQRGYGGLFGREWAMKGVVGLEGVCTRLRRAILGKQVD